MSWNGLNWNALSWGGASWLPAVWGLGALAFVVLLFSYIRAASRPRAWLAAAVKAVVFALLLVCLLEPLVIREQPKPGENLFLVIADNSRSMTLRDAGELEGRGPSLVQSLVSSPAWQSKLTRQFEVKSFQFDNRVAPLAGFQELNFDGDASRVYSTLRDLRQRYDRRAVAGVLLISDGVSTDELPPRDELSQWPPVHVLTAGRDEPSFDLRIRQVAVTQTNFEAAPITIRVDLDATGIEAAAKVEVVDEEDRVVASQVVPYRDDSSTQVARLEFQPTREGLIFYRIRCSIDNADAVGKTEVTLENNEQWVVVDRGGGPYRVLYVAGRPNWEFKYMRRAVTEDREVDLVGLIRVARKEPKFDFRSRENESTNPLYRGFGNEDAEDAEQYDQPVLMRLNIDDGELPDGFPKGKEELFKFDAVILDDLEAGFFTQNQLSLLQQFVSERGGGLLMLGGRESFARGEYDRTPVGEMLPVYVQRESPQDARQRFQYNLSREGWLEPWLRLRPVEADERYRLADMPEFRAVHRITAIKPGASILGEVRNSDGERLPAVVTQPFGRGRVGAILFGDLWRWGLRRDVSAPKDLDAAWRQTVRWLVSDVPRRISVEVHEAEDQGGKYRIVAEIRDEAFEPQVNASVKIELQTPGGRTLTLPVDPSSVVAGSFETEFLATEDGPYRGKVLADGPDGQRLGEAELGWVHQPTFAEFSELRPRFEQLAEVAKATGGQVVSANDLTRFVGDLSRQRAPVMERSAQPLWHSWWILGLALVGLAAEWSIRRLNGLA